MEHMGSCKMRTPDYQGTQLTFACAGHIRPARGQVCPTNQLPRVALARRREVAIMIWPQFTLVATGASIHMATWVRRLDSSLMAACASGVATARYS